MAGRARILCGVLVVLAMMLAAAIAGAQLYGVPVLRFNSASTGLVLGELGLTTDEAPTTGSAVVAVPLGNLIPYELHLDCGIPGQDPIPSSHTTAVATVMLNVCGPYTEPGTYHPKVSAYSRIGPILVWRGSLDLDTLTVTAPAADVTVTSLAIDAGPGLEPVDPVISAGLAAPVGAVDWDLTCDGDDGIFEVQSLDVDGPLSSTECPDFEVTGTQAETRTICVRATVGGVVSAKRCAQFTVTPEVARIVAFTCQPSSGSDPLSAVQCAVAWVSNGGTATVSIKADAGAGCPVPPGSDADCRQAVNVAPGTWDSLVDGGAAFSYTAGDYAPAVTITDTDGLAPVVSSSGSVQVTAAPGEDTFGIRFAPSASQCQIDASGSCSVSVEPFCSGSATGPLGVGALACGANGTASLGEVVANPGIGVNLEQFSYWESGMPTADRMRASSINPDTGWSLGGAAADLVLDSDGWPMSFTGGAGDYIYALINRNVARVGAVPDVGHYASGVYDYSCTGTGVIDFDFDGASADQACPGSGTFTVANPTASGGIMVKIKSIAAGPLKIVVNDPTSATGSWRDEFLAVLNGARVLRMMEWMRTNWNPPGTWAARMLSTARSWATTEDGEPGVPVEAMVDLANASQKDPWFTLPDTADDDYVTNFAAYVCANLDPDLRVYVERGNEIWNNAYPWWRATGRAAAAGAAPPYSYTDNHAHRWKIARSMQDWAIFEAAAGCSDARVVNVLGVQNADPSKTAATFMAWDPPTAGVPAGTAASWIEAVAVAPYWNLGDGAGGVYSLNPTNAAYAGISNADCTAAGQGPGYAVTGCTGPGTGTLPGTNIRDWSPAQWQASMLADIPYVLAYSAQHAANLAPYGIDLLAYEGGNHVQNSATSDAVLVASMIAAQEEAGMGTVMNALLDGWRELGGGLFVYYELLARCGTGSCWGAGEFLDTYATAPKYVALMANAQNSCLSDPAGSGSSCSWTAAGAKVISDSGWTREGVADADATTGAVTVVAAPAAPNLVAVCPDLVFNATRGTGAGPPTAKVCTVANTGGGTLASTVTVTEDPDTWSASALPGTLTTTTEQDPVTVSVPDPDDLTVGAHFATLRIENDDDTGDAQEFAVRYDVQQPAGQPGVGCNCSTRGEEPFCLGSSATITSRRGSEHTLNLAAVNGSNQYLCGIYANGDIWIQAQSGSVVIESRVPGQGSNTNGWMVNPPTWNTNQVEARGSDEFFVAPPAIAGQTFTNFPAVFVSEKGRSTPLGNGTCDKLNDGNRSCMGSLATFVFVSAPPDSDGDQRTDDEFRPHIHLSHTQKAGPYRVDQLDDDAWPTGLSAGAIAGEKTMAECRAALRDPYGLPFLKLNLQDQEIPFDSAVGTSSYGADNQRDHHNCILSMMLDNSGITRAELDKPHATRSAGAQALINLVQRTIDLYGFHRAGKDWAMGPSSTGGLGLGAHWIGKKEIALVGAHLLRAADPTFVAFAQGANPAPGARIFADDFMFYPSPNPSENGKIYMGVNFNNCQTASFTDPSTSDVTSPFCRPKGSEASYPGNCTGSSGPYDNVCGADAFGNWQYPFYWANASVGDAAIVYHLGARGTYNNDSVLRFATERKRATGYPIKADCGLCNEDADTGISHSANGFNGFARDFWNAFCEGGYAPVCTP